MDVFPIRNICLFLSLSTASSPGLCRYCVGEVSSGWFWMLLLLKLGHVPSVENELLRINIYTLILAWMMVLAFYSQQKEREHYPNPKSKIFYPFAVNLFWGKKSRPDLYLLETFMLGSQQLSVTRSALCLVFHVFGKLTNLLIQKISIKTYKKCLWCLFPKYLILSNSFAIKYYKLPQIFQCFDICILCIPGTCTAFRLCLWLVMY